MHTIEVGRVGPALWVSSTIKLRKTRCLPLDGDVLVDAGESVKAEDVVARQRRAAPPAILNVAKALGLRDAGDVAGLLLKSPGDAVKAGEVLAQRKGTLGLGRRVCTAPIDGVVASGPTSTGELLINPLSDGVEVLARIPGVVTGIIPARGAIIESTGAYVQGLAWTGHDTQGVIRGAVRSSGDEISSESIDEACAGAIIFGGHIGPTAVMKAALAGVQAVVVGSVIGSTYRWLLENPQPLTVVVTDVFGSAPMAKPTFELLLGHAGQMAVIFVPTETSWDGAPAEIFVPVTSGAVEADQHEMRLRGGATVRVSRGTLLGTMGRITRLPGGRCSLPSGVQTDVVEVETEGGSRIVVGRSNVELVG